MNALKLVMGYRHPQQWIQAVIRMDEVNEVANERFDFCRVLRWFIDHRAGGFIF